MLKGQVFLFTIFKYLYCETKQKSWEIKYILLWYPHNCLSCPAATVKSTSWPRPIWHEGIMETHQSDLHGAYFLLLNSDKTEILLVGPKDSTQNLLDYNLQLDGCTVTSSTVKNLGVILDSNLSFENHISNVTKTAFFHLRNISKLRNMLSVSDAEKLVHAFMTSRLDYCNALLGGCPASSINKLQIVQNAAARVLTRSRKYDHITPILQSLHWLPIKFRISYKILLLAYKALNDLAPAYLTNLLSRYNPTRSLRSQNSGLLVVPRIAKSTKGGRTFSYLAPKLWNSLPENVRGSDTLSLFKSRLKTHLFSQAFI